VSCRDACGVFLEPLIVKIIIRMEAQVNRAAEHNRLPL